MHILFTDETNLEAKDGVEFFVYGGLIIPADKLTELDARISAARAKAGYKPDDELKFETNARPKNVEIPTCTKLKEETIAAAIDCGCQFIATVVLHDIAKNREPKQLIEHGANTVIGAFNKFLTVSNSYGIVAVDRLASKDEYRLLTERFTKGLVFPAGNMPPRALDRIKLFTSTCINASHASSAMDVVLGAFRYCINAPKNEEAAKKMMLSVTKLIWCTREGDKIFAHDRGLLFRPKKVDVAQFAAKYDDLLGRINALLK